MQDKATLESVAAEIAGSRGRDYFAAPMIGGDQPVGEGRPVTAPANRADVVGHVIEATVADAPVRAQLAVAAGGIEQFGVHRARQPHHVVEALALQEALRRPLSAPGRRRQPANVLPCSIARLG